MSSVAQLAGMLLLAAQAGTPWPQGPPPALWERADPQRVSGGGYLAAGQGQVFPKSVASPWNGGGSSPEPSQGLAKGSPAGTGSGGGSGMGDGSRRGATPLAPPGAEKKQTGAQGTRSFSSPASVLKVAAALGLVLGLFLIVAWGMRRVSPANPPPLPTEALEVLGRAVLAGRQQVHLLRLGRKLVLVSVTPAGIETVCEVTEPEEVDRLAGLCRQAMPGSATAAFREVLQQVVGKGEGKAA